MARRSLFKWETTQTVNNIPTIYSNTGDTPVDRISKVEAINGSKNIKVTTELAHGLTIGDPISVQGLSQYQAEGFFIVTSVPDTLTFFFELDVIANFSGDISYMNTSKMNSQNKKSQYAKALLEFGTSKYLEIGTSSVSLNNGCVDGDDLVFKKKMEFKVIQND